MATAYITAPTDVAADIASTLVEERLAACVNTVSCTSTYRWEGAVHEDEEMILFAKTTSERASALTDRVEELHPYDVPCIEIFDETETLPEFAQWRAESVE